MKRNHFVERLPVFQDNDSCLEWLKSRLYPDGIECKKCKKVTKHHKISKRHCYECDNCGNHVYPSAGTIFHKSTIPLKTWFEIINRMYDAKGNLSAKQIQKEYGMSYKTTLRMFKNIKMFLGSNSLKLTASKNIGDDNSGNLERSPDFHTSREKQHELPTTSATGLKARSHDNSKVPIVNPYVEIGSQPVENKRIYHEKTDRSARLLRIQVMLWQYPDGLEVSGIAKRCGVSERTVYRDLEALEYILKVPIWAKGNKRGIDKGYFLPPILFSREEARNIFLAARLMQNYSRNFDPSITSTFMKLNSIIKPTLGKQIQNILEHMYKLPRDAAKERNFGKLMEAWLYQHPAKIDYLELPDGKIKTYTVEIYFIEPTTLNRSSFLVAYCPLNNSICTFNIDSIVGEVKIENDTYEIPSSFDAIDNLGASWGIFSDENSETVKLRFNNKISLDIMNITWHSSQKTELQRDKSVIVTLKVSNTFDFRRWILGWGNLVEVLEPQTLKDQIYAMAKGITDIYR